jgi:ketosteroid isomerase-like protein
MRAGRRGLSAMALGCALLIAGVAPARAETEADAAAVIRTALAKWVVDFNTGNTRAVCDLFAPDLRYDYRGFPERDYRTVCDLLQRSLTNPSRSFRYGVEIKEVLVSGDLAAVRLVWTLTASGTGISGVSISEEVGLDIFRRQDDGRWRIVRYIAYEEEGPPKTGAAK